MFKTANRNCPEAFLIQVRRGPGKGSLQIHRGLRRGKVGGWGQGLLGHWGWGRRQGWLGLHYLAGLGEGGAACWEDVLGRHSGSLVYKLLERECLNLVNIANAYRFLLPIHSAYGYEVITSFIISNSYIHLINWSFWFSYCQFKAFLMKS